MAQLLSNLPIGAKVKFGKYSVNGETAQPITWLVVAKNHTSTPAYPTNSVTLLTEKIIDLRCWDAKEPSNTDTDRQVAGNNTYHLSNIDQWLNKDSIEWYSATHSVDNPPDVNSVSYSTSYSTRPGFLNAFSSYEKNAILSTNIKSALPGSSAGGNTLARKVFLPSWNEVGFEPTNFTSEGQVWSYFSTGGTTKTTLTSSAFNNTLCTQKPALISGGWDWWLRTPYHQSYHYVRWAKRDGTGSYSNAFDGTGGVRPALNLLSTNAVSDTTDSEGCYSVIFNSAPAQPSILNVPTIYGGKSNAISWSSATDPDGDALTYTLECSLDGGEYSTLYDGASTAYAHIVPFGTTSVAYRVKATDTSRESSPYTFSTTVTVINNNAPVISGSDENLGVKSDGFSGTYYIEDANRDTVTVTESIDGVQIRTLIAPLGQEITYGITGNTWLAIPNGSHTLTIRATDGIDSSVRTYTFTKLVDAFTIRNSAPWHSATMPSRIMLVVTRNIPDGATFKVEVCNNGYDTEPTWEDATDAVRSGLVHVFTNNVKFAGQWGVLVRVSVNRNNATGACYVSAIGGNFE